MHPMPGNRCRQHRASRLLAALWLTAALAGCGNNAARGEKGDPGPAGPAGAKGDAGPRGPAGTGLRIVRSNCDTNGCAVQCSDDEVLITAYCGASHNSAIFPTERSASCRLHNPANSPILAACAKAAQ